MVFILHQQMCFLRTKHSLQYLHWWHWHWHWPHRHWIPPSNLQCNVFSWEWHHSQKWYWSSWKIFLNDQYVPKFSQEGLDIAQPTRLFLCRESCTLQKLESWNYAPPLYTSSIVKNLLCVFISVFKVLISTYTINRLIST